VRCINISGELLVANRQTNAGQTLYDPATGKFVKPALVSQDGVVTWTFEETDPPEKYYDPVTGKWYFAALVTQDGVVTWTFNEV